MSVPLLTAEQLEEAPEIQYADDLERHRDLQRPPAPSRIPAASNRSLLLPDIGPIVGYAVTSKTSAAFTLDTGPDLTGDYLRYVAAQPGPKIAVGEDVDDPPGLGAQFGEVNTTIHQKLGCVGHITSGCPRDLDEVHALGFALYGLDPCVSHAYVRLVDFGQPVTIGGVVIQPGDLLHADKHGVCIIPLEVAARLAEACGEVERLERPLLELCRSEAFDLDEYLAGART